MAGRKYSILIRNTTCSGNHMVDHVNSPLTVIKWFRVGGHHVNPKVMHDSITSVHADFIEYGANQRRCSPPVHTQPRGLFTPQLQLMLINVAGATYIIDLTFVTWRACSIPSGDIKWPC